MKKHIVFITVLFCILMLMACNKSDTSITITSGNYKMELSQEQQNGEKIAPVITINIDDKSFLFSYDVLSSYINIGTYEINDNILTATTSDEKYHYVFEIVDENTLSFLEEQSSKITVFDTAFSVVPQNGAVFQKE